MIEPLLTAASAHAIADLKTAIADFLRSAEKSATLADLETAFLNALEAAGSELLVEAKGLGSVLLQSLIGLVLAKLTGGAA